MAASGSAAAERSTAAMPSVAVLRHADLVGLRVSLNRCGAVCAILHRCCIVRSSLLHRPMLLLAAFCGNLKQERRQCATDRLHIALRTRK